MASALAADALRARFDARVGERAGPLLVALALAFAFFAVVTFVVQPPGTLPLLVIDGGGALLLGAAATALWRRPTTHGNLVAALALLLTLAASLVALKLLSLPSQTTNLILIQLVASVVLLSRIWVVVLVVSSLAGWAVVAQSEGWGEAWLNAGFALVATALMSGMVHVVRVREARVTEELLAQNAQKTRKLESAVAAERENARELALANDSLQAFTYVVSHDLKEPLRALRAYLEDLAEVVDDAEAKERYRRVAASEAQLERLVQGLLEWSRASTAPQERATVHIGELLDEPITRQLFDKRLVESRGRLLVDRDIPPVEAAPSLLRQALGNLVLNALRHNPRPDPQIRVYAVADAPQGMVEIVIEDNGPGFPAAVLDRVARLGSQPSTVKGGFGLTITRRAAERMGGQLHISNAPGGGARAHLLLPAAGHPPTRDRAMAAETHPSSSFSS